MWQGRGLPGLSTRLLALLAIYAVLLAGAAARHMRPDEAITYHATGRDLAFTVVFHAQDVHAPLYFVAFHLWQQVAGDGELAGRVFSLLLCMLTLALVYHLGRRWFGAVAGLAALIAVGLSSYFFRYGLEVRPYALVILAGTVSMLCFDRWLQRRTWRSALDYGLSLALMLYVHYFGAFLFLAQGAYWLLAGRRAWTLWRQGIAAVAAALLFWLPWLPVFIGQVRHVGALVEESQTRIPGLGMAATTLPTDLPTLSRFALLATNGLPLLYALLLLAGLLLLRRERRYWLAAAWGVGVPLAAFLLNLIVPVYEPRYVVVLVPGLGLLVGASLAALPGRWKAAALPVFCLAALLTVQSGIPQRVPLRDYLQALEAALRPGDAVYLYDMTLDWMAAYHYRHYAPTALESLILATVDQQQDDALPRCVWFVTDDWFNPQVRARFEQIEDRRPLQQIIGDERYLLQRLCAPPEGEPVLFGRAMRFLGADLDSVGEGQIALKLWWDALEPPAHDYSIGVYLLDASGALVAQQDGPLFNFWLRQPLETSAMQPGVYYIDYRVLALPPDLPGGRYSLALAVYQSWDGARLPIAGQEGDLLTFHHLTLP